MAGGYLGAVAEGTQWFLPTLWVTALSTLDRSARRPPGSPTPCQGGKMEHVVAVRPRGHTIAIAAGVEQGGEQ